MLTIVYILLITQIVIESAILGVCYSGRPQICKNKLRLRFTEKHVRYVKYLTAIKWVVVIFTSLVLVCLPYGIVWVLLYQFYCIFLDEAIENNKDALTELFRCHGYGAVLDSINAGSGYGNSYSGPDYNDATLSWGLSIPEISELLYTFTEYAVIVFILACIAKIFIL